MPRFILVVVFAMVSGLFAQSAFAQSHPAIVASIESSSKRAPFVGMLVYNNPENWMNSTQLSAASWREFSRGNAVLSAHVNHPGDYAIVFFLDMNGDKYLNRNFFGPTEPFQLVSGNSTGKLGRPTFENALVPIHSGTNTFMIKF